jgi:hypothetical protein
MKTGTIARLAEVIGYPERVDEDAASYVFQVDGIEITAVDGGARLRLECRLTDDESALPRLASYAAGRILREEAALACDREGAFLWREIAANADKNVFQREFEAFAASCEWWRARLEDRPGGGEPLPFPEMMIRP